MSNSEGFMMFVDENGVAKEYDSTWDIVIHCETEEEHNDFIKLFNEFLNSKKEGEE